MSTATSAALANIVQAIRDSDFERANALALEALAQGALDPALFNVQAMWHERHGRDAEAVALYRRSAELAPADLAILNARGLCLARLKRFDEAVADFDKAIGIRPDYALSHYRRGHTLWQAGRLAEAEESLRRSLRLGANSSEALSCLAAVAAARGNISAAGSYARQVLQSAPTDPIAVSVAAAADLADGKGTQAEARLRPLLDAQGLAADARLTVLGLYGRALHLQGRANESFDTYAARNALLQTQLRAASPSLSIRLRSLNDFLGRAAPSFWHTFEQPISPEEQRPEQHVFLGGFPRSGAEVLAGLLARHPGIALLRDVDPLCRAASEYLTGSGIRNFAALGVKGLAAERTAYWAGVRASGLSFGGKVLIDNSPANAVRLPLIAKLFPTARVLSMQRDPRDIVASCFMELPRVSETLAGAFDIGQIAQLFDDVAKIVRASRDRMSLPVAAVRYETLVAHVEVSLSATCEFIGVNWERAPFERPGAREDDFGYFSEQPGMWRAWAEQLSSVLPVLEPWLNEGGYD
jgi:Tfp pilus assembly protein PilF